MNDLWPIGPEPRRIVEELGLEPHPEGGWFRRVWTAETLAGEEVGESRAAGSAIEYLMEAGAESRWHRIDASEVWTLAAGDPVVLSTSEDGAEPQEVVLGLRSEGGVAQSVVQPGVWQSARTAGEWSLVVCVVVPEFRFEAFELAPPGWRPDTR